MRKLKIATIVGTRPEIIRLSAVIKKLSNSKSIKHYLVHTGQNYDFELNEIEPGEYWIQLRALISNNWFNYSYSKTIKRLTGSEPEVTIEKIKLSPDQIIKIEVTSKGI